MPARTIVISGGSRGLGLGFVRHFLAAGDTVATFSRVACEEIRLLQSDTELKSRLIYQSVDAANASALREFVKVIFDQTGRVDALINNAGLAHDGVLATMPDDQIDQML